MKNKLILSISLACGIFAIILILDLLSKHFVFQALPNESDSMDVISGFFNFLHVENTGAAWGMLAGKPIFLIVISIAILAVYMWFYILRLKKHKGDTSILLSISVGFIVGGCLGNLVDRIVLGYVRDFIHLQFMDFPVFNVADISLTIGIILMVIYFIFIYSKEDKKFEVIQKSLSDFRDESKIIDFSSGEQTMGELQQKKEKTGKNHEKSVENSKKTSKKDKSNKEGNKDER